MYQHQGYYSLVLEAFTLLNIEGANNGKRKPRAPNVAVEITVGCLLALEWDEMFARYLRTLSKFKLKEEVCFAAKVNIMHIQGLKDRLNALMKYTEYNDLNQSIKKSKLVASKKKSSSV